jgi:HAD superfamily hydrolase (TIGR01509 family)
LADVNDAHGQFPGAAAIFDLDGTLANSMPVHYRAWEEIAGAFGLQFPERRFYSMGGIPTLQIASRLIAEQGLDLDPLVVTLAKEKAFLSRFEEVAPIAPVVEIARRRRAQGPVAVGSGGTRAMVERTLRQIGLLDWFPVIVTAEDTLRHKPEPDVFLEAARRLGVDAGSCVVYEDTDLGLEAARRAGMLGIDVRPLYAHVPSEAALGGSPSDSR